MNTGRFYTLFWILYFPVCLVLYSKQEFQYVDELLTIVLFLYAVFVSRRRNAKEYRREISMYIGIMIFYLLYSIAIGVTSIRGVMLDFFQQIRPYIVFYSTIVLIPQLNDKQRKLIIFVTLASSFYYFYHVDFDKDEDGMLSVIFLICGIAYYYFTRTTAFNRNIAIIIMLLGLLSGKNKYFGQCVVFLYLISFLRHKIKFSSVKTYISLIIMSVIVLFFSWTKFSGYYINGFKSDAEEMARPMSYITGYEILWDYFPFGSGLGSFCTAAAAKEYSPLYYKYDLDHIWGMSPDNTMFIADCYYPGLAEFGIVGVFLFCVFWKRRLIDIQKIRDIKYYRLALMCMLTLAIDSTSNTAYLSGGGMAIFIILAMCINSARTDNNKQLYA